jgi:spermidine/putrescine transport system substrate-binding protein
MLDDMREVMAVALKLQSQSLNSTDEAKLRKAQELLKTLKPKIKMFRSDVIDTLVNKEVVVAHTFSSDALQAARKSKGKIEYILPAEGGSRSIDNMVILKSAHNVQEAHVLINFLLSQKSNVEFVNHIMGGAVLKSTRSGLERDLQVNKALFPDPTLLNKFEFIHDLGASTRVYDRLWTELKAQ